MGKSVDAVSAQVPDQFVFLKKIDLHYLVALLDQSAQVPQSPARVSHCLLAGLFKLSDRILRAKWSRP